MAGSKADHRLPPNGPTTVPQSPVAHYCPPRPERPHEPRDPPVHLPEPEPAIALDLHFDLPAALRLAEHAQQAPRHASYGGHEPVPALVWGKSLGAFLISNGRPRSDDCPGIYAEGGGPCGQRAAEQDPGRR